MKIFIKYKRIPEEFFEQIKRSFPNVNFVREIEESYDADALIVDPKYVTEENMRNHSNLKWIQLFTAGFNTIDLDCVNKRHITLTNARGVYSITIAEDVVCKILAFNRNVNYYFHNMQERIWNSLNNEVEIYGSTVGIIGVGSISREIAKRIKAFDAKVIGYRRNNKAEEYFDEIYYGDDGLNSVLRNSDYVILALPLNKESEGLINIDKIKLMKPNALFINIARGEIVVQDDLIYALKNRLIRGAALDVTVPEPLPSDNELWKLDNVFLTPHNSPSSPYIFKRITELLITNIGNFVNNKELINIIKE